MQDNIPHLHQDAQTAQAINSPMSGHRNPCSHLQCPQIVLVPSLLLYLMEKTVRWLWPALRWTDLVDVELIPGKERVVCLRMAKPTSFHYRCAFEYSREDPCIVIDVSGWWDEKVCDLVGSLLRPLNASVACLVRSIWVLSSDPVKIGNPNVPL